MKVWFRFVATLVVIAWTVAGANASDKTPTTAAEFGTETADREGNEINDLAFSFSLPNATGGWEVSLDSFRGNKNIVLVFYRTFW